MKTKHTEGEWFNSGVEVVSISEILDQRNELLEALNNLINANINNKGESVMRVIEKCQETLKKATS